MRFDPVRVACEADTPDAFDRAVLDALSRDVGFDVAFLALKTGEVTATGLDPLEVARAMHPGGAFERDLLPVKRAALARRGVAVDTEVLGAAGVERTMHYRHFARPLGGRHSLIAYLVVRGRVIGGLTLGRTGGPFRASEVGLVEDLLPGLSIARASFAPSAWSGGPLCAQPRRWWSPGQRELGRRREDSVDIRVRDRDGYREMVAHDRASGQRMLWSRASLADPSRSGWPYVDLLHVAAGLAQRVRRALFIGCGGAVGPRQFATTYPGVRLDVVEREGAVVELARAFFAVDDIPNLAVHVADGVAFVEQAAPESWDVAVIDAYEGASLGGGFSGRSFFAALRRALRPGGAMAFNVVGSLEAQSPVRAVARAAESAFADVRLVPVMTTQEEFLRSAERNVVIVAIRD